MMIVNGLSALLSSQTTREVKLSCGFSLHFKKFALKDYAMREQFIVRNRGCVSEKLQEILESLSNIPEDQKDVRDALLTALKDAVVAVTTKDSYAYYDEELSFMLSNECKAVEIFIACKDNSECITCLDDARVLVHGSISEEERGEIEDALAWSKELGLLKKPDSPPEAQGTETATTPAGEP